MRDNKTMNDATTFEATKELENINVAKDILMTPKRQSTTRLMDMINSGELKQSSMKLPKRPKLVQFNSAIQAEDTVEDNLRQLGLMLAQWNEIITQVETFQSMQEQGISDEKKF